MDYCKLLDYLLQQKGNTGSKDAMGYNHSPALVFASLEEDETDYTTVTALINEEFAAIRAGETEQQLLALLKQSPSMTNLELGEALGGRKELYPRFFRY